MKLQELKNKYEASVFNELSDESLVEKAAEAVGCAKTIEEELANLDGVEKATVDFDKKTATVSFDKTIQNPESLTKVVQETGDGKTYKVSNFKS